MKVFDEDEEYITESFKKKRRLSKKSSKASKPTPQISPQVNLGALPNISTNATPVDISSSDAPASAAQQAAAAANLSNVVFTDSKGEPGGGNNYDCHLNQVSV